MYYVTGIADNRKPSKHNWLAQCWHSAMIKEQGQHCPNIHVFMGQISVFTGVVTSVCKGLQAINYIDYVIVKLYMCSDRNVLIHAINYMDCVTVLNTRVHHCMYIYMYIYIHCIYTVCIHGRDVQQLVKTHITIHISIRNKSVRFILLFIPMTLSLYCNRDF